MALVVFCIRHEIADNGSLVGGGTVAGCATGFAAAWHASGLAGLAGAANAWLRGGHPSMNGCGFSLAPRKSMRLGRLGDPQLVVEFAHHADDERAMELAAECESAQPRQRRELCDAIEAEAVALVEADGPERTPFLLLAPEPLAPGVIGVVPAGL